MAQGKTVQSGRDGAWGGLALRLALLTAMACALLPLAPGFSAWEAASEDLRFALRGPRPTTARIVLANITEETFVHWPEPLALWGAHFAAALRTALDGGAAAVGLDVVPAMDADRYLEGVARTVLERNGRTAAQIARFGGQLPKIPDLQPNTALLAFLQDRADRVVLSEGAHARPFPDLYTGGAVVARVDPPAQPEPGVVRQMVAGYDRQPMLATALARIAGVGQVPERYGINFVAPHPGIAFVRIPLHRFVDGPLTPSERTALNGAVVLIVPEYADSNDLHTAVLRQEFSGGELHAHALASLLDGQPLRRGTLWPEALTTLGAALAGIALLRLPVRFVVGLAALLGLAASWGMAVQFAFVRGSLLLPLVAPLLGLALPFAAFHLTQAVAERRLRRQVERIFGQYLSPTVRDYLLAAPQNRQLGGREAEATVLFFDLRGSTAFAEGRAPADVLAELNRLFSRVVPALQRHDGTVLRYNGDGFLAVFGAPYPRPDHARGAVQAVCNMSQDIAQWNAERAQAGEAPWGFGVGLHSGLLVWGSLGSVDRPELTLIGDTVNIAARLQEATKALQTNVVASEETWRLAGCPPARGPIALEIRGRKEPLPVYALEEGNHETT